MPSSWFSCSGPGLSAKRSASCSKRRASTRATSPPSRPSTRAACYCCGWGRAGRRGRRIRFSRGCWAGTWCLGGGGLRTVVLISRLSSMWRQGWCLRLAKLSIQGSKVTGDALSEPIKEMLSPEIRGKIRERAWPVFASLSWAFVMYVFRWYPDMIQPSLRSSMKYMYVTAEIDRHRFILTQDRYVNSDHWDSFRNFLIHNQ